MPMWFRGPDLKLRAGQHRLCRARSRASDAEDGGRRAGSNWSKARRSAAPLANAAIGARRRTSRRRRRMPATIGGARRMLRVSRRAAGRPAASPATRSTSRNWRSARGGLTRFGDAQRDDARPAVGRRRAVRRRSQPGLLQPAVPPHVRDAAPNGWPTGPSSTACSSACARRTGCPRCAIFPAGRRERRDWFTGAGGASRRTGRCRRHASARRRPADARRRAAADLRGSHRAGRSLPARATRCCASAPRPSTVCSKRSRCSRRRAAAAVEPPFRAGCGASTRRSSTRIRGSTRWSRRRRQAGATRPARDVIGDLVRAATRRPPAARRRGSRSPTGAISSSPRCRCPTAMRC